MPIQFDANGIITQNITEILDEREEALKPVMGEDFVVDKTTPIGNMEVADAYSELTIQELIAWMFPNMLDANTAEGNWLETICEKNRIYRKQAEYTKISFKIIGTPNTTFYAGDITVSDSFYDVYYDLYEDCTLNEEGVAYGRFICEEYGENYPHTSSTLNILTPLLELKDVIIDEDNVNLSIGRDMETDEELRRRREYSVQQTSMSTSGSINANLYSLDGVQHVKYFENDTEQENEDGLPMKSFEFVVDGGDSKEIANTIFLNKPLGTRAYGQIIEEVKDSNNNVYQIGFTRADIVNIGINIQVTTSTPETDAWKNTVIQSIKEKFDDIQNIGTVVKDYNYFTVLTQYSDITDIISLQFYNVDSESPEYYNQYPITKKQIAKLDKDNIHITIGI